MVSFQVDQARVRWLHNLGVYLSAVAATTLALTAARLAGGGIVDAVTAIVTWIVATVWVAVTGLFVLVPYLALIEVFFRRAARRRVVAIALGAAVAVGGVLLSQAGDVTLTFDSVVGAVAAGLLGAVYGALVRLPVPPSSRDIPAR